ncbi:hypothetical protein K402DRAFT_454102 [Aulographum hederae CBS 113979]|uniref:GATA-type domain-containing protein n=1 Tax=Aulographum hederae CBS 113979 TaxID=1176131 RepID=A0A6G1H1G6_9PEZI|nr:hypothetical protein K402DRAFT_454102 [Aulographum hederae CBS 113979]
MSSPDGGSNADHADDEVDTDLPKKLMRVKVLYTFDLDSKTNCLTRISSPQQIPTATVENGAQVGIVSLKKCIEAVIQASPEIVSRLEQDYTMYAYDYSEYETPLVGQGYLSYLLASLSPTAPARQSQAMVTGRVCQNIMGLFSSNGIKETLEVKLKLVPVPSDQQSGYIENMEMYRAKPRGAVEELGSSNWSGLYQPTPQGNSLSNRGSAVPPTNTRSDSGGIESLHQYLTQGIGADEPGDYDVFMFDGSLSSRVGSPTPSHQSSTFPQTSTQQIDISRPSSRQSARTHRHPLQRTNSAASMSTQDQEFEEGPAKKRARLTQSEWRGRSSFGASRESLRVTASSAASVRNFRPAPVNSSVFDGPSELPPRPPTPRAQPHHPSLQRTATGRSSLRNETSQEIHAAHQRDLQQLDSAMYSADEDDGPSPDIPSSPPIFNNDDVDSPSSPLPTNPYHTDSGFLSDAAASGSGNHAKSTNGGITNVSTWTSVMPGDPAELPKTFTKPAYKTQRNAACAQRRRSVKPSESGIHPEFRRGQSNPLPGAELGLGHEPYSHSSPKASGTPQSNLFLEHSEFPYPNDDEQSQLQFNNTRMQPANSDSAVPVKTAANLQHSQTRSMPGSPLANQTMHTDSETSLERFKDLHVPPIHLGATSPCMPSSEFCDCEPLQAASRQGEMPVHFPATSPPGQSTEESLLPAELQDANHASVSNGRASDYIRSVSASTLGRSVHVPGSSSALDNKKNDCQGIGTSGEPRSGSGVKRKKIIKENLALSISQGEMPVFCANCGEINTVTWRKAFTRVEKGDPVGKIQFSREIGGIIGWEILKKAGDGEEGEYRIFKKIPSGDDVRGRLLEEIVLCNPCGLWFGQHGTMRPPEKWMKKKKGGKRKPKQQSQAGAPLSDFGQEPSSALFTDPVGPGLIGDSPPDYDSNPVPPQEQTHTVIMNSTNEPTSSNSLQIDPAAAALQKALQASPGKFVGSQTSPIDVDAEHLSSHPTRRLLFPSPRKDGQSKSLENESPSGRLSKSVSPSIDAANPAVTNPHDVSTVHEQLPMPRPNPLPLRVEETDKENLPPADNQEDDLAYLFEDDNDLPTFTTPRKQRTPPAAFKTPDSKTNSATRKALEDLVGAQSSAAAIRSNPSQQNVTPSRSRSSQTNQNESGDGDQGNVLPPLTPFMAQVNQILANEDLLNHLGTTPNQIMEQLDNGFGMPTFNTPPGAGGNKWVTDDEIDDILGTKLMGYQNYNWGPVLGMDENDTILGVTVGGGVRAINPIDDGHQNRDSQANGSSSSLGNGNGSGHKSRGVSAPFNLYVDPDTEWPVPTAETTAETQITATVEGARKECEDDVFVDQPAQNEKRKRGDENVGEAREAIAIPEEKKRRTI